MIPDTLENTVFLRKTISRRKRTLFFFQIWSSRTVEEESSAQILQNIIMHLKTGTHPADFRLGDSCACKKAWTSKRNTLNKLRVRTSMYS
jgi:hypothetical protein